MGTNDKAVDLELEETLAIDADTALKQRWAHHGRSSWNAKVEYCDV